jgi:hypothetical protein
VDAGPGESVSVESEPLGGLGDWDIDLLASEFEELQAIDFDLTLTGFDAKEIDSFTLQPNEVEDEVPPVPAVQSSPDQLSARALEQHSTKRTVMVVGSDFDSHYPVRMRA